MMTNQMAILIPIYYYITLLHAILWLLQQATWLVSHITIVAIKINIAL